MLPTVKSLFLKIQCMNTSFFHGAGFAPSPRKTCRKGILHRFPNDLTGAGCAADSIHCRTLRAHHLIKNRFRRGASSVFVLQKLNAFQPVIPDSDPNPCPDNTGVAPAFIYAVFYLYQVDFIKGESTHLRFIISDGFEV